MTGLALTSEPSMGLSTPTSMSKPALKTCATTTLLIYRILHAILVSTAGLQQIALINVPLDA